MNYPPYNHIDQCSKRHDLDYVKAFQEPDPKRREKMIRLADDRVLRCYDRYPNEESYIPSRLGITAKKSIENNLPIVAKLFGKYKGR